MFSSIVALHVEKQVGGSAVNYIATGFSIYLILRGVLQIPISKYLDKNKSNKDEVYSMLLGAVLLSLSFLAYEFVNLPIHLYLVNILYGLGAAFYLPAWRKYFAIYSDNGSKGLNYAYSDVIFSVSGALAAILGGYLVKITGSFTYVFLTATLLSLIGGFNLIQLVKKTE